MPTTMLDRDEIIRAAARVLRDDPRAAAVPLFEELPGGTQVAMLTSLFAARPTWFLRALLAAIGDLIEEHPDKAVEMFLDPMNDGLDDDADEMDDVVGALGERANGATHADGNHEPDDSGDIVTFFHCAQCGDERPDGESPRDWARFEVGLTADRRLQVRCIRHECEVGTFEVTPHRLREISKMPGCGHV
jgi:hypothetical protein